MVNTRTTPADAYMFFMEFFGIGDDGAEEAMYIASIGFNDEQIQRSVYIAEFIKVNTTDKPVSVTPMKITELKNIINEKFDPSEVTYNSEKNRWQVVRAGNVEKLRAIYQSFN